MRILEAVSGHDRNGAAVHALLLCRGLRERGHEVSLLCLPRSWAEGRAQAEGLPVLASDMHRWPPDELRRVGAEARAGGFDLVHTHLSRAHLFGVLLRLLTGRPCAATAHSCRLQPHWMLNDRVIAVSAAVARFQRRFNRVPASRLEVVHGFVEADRFAPGRHHPAAARAALGVAAEGPLLGFVGSLFREKGLLDLVRALPAVAAEVPSVRLVLVGRGPEDYTALLRAEASRLGVADRLVFTGPREDVAPLLPAFDVLVLPSRDDGFSLAVAEAMAAGVPVVATRVGGVPECVEEGRTGLLVPPRRPPALAAALASLLRDPSRRRAMGEAARARVIERFSAEVQVPQVVLALERAALRGQGRASARPVRRTR